MKDVDEFAARMAEQRRKASGGAHKVEVVRIAAVHKQGLTQRFGPLFGKSCGPVFDAVPASVSDELRQAEYQRKRVPLGISKKRYKAPTLSAAVE